MFGTELESISYNILVGIKHVSNDHKSASGFLTVHNVIPGRDWHSILSHWATDTPKGNASHMFHITSFHNTKGIQRAIALETLCKNASVCGFILAWIFFRGSWVFYIKLGMRLIANEDGELGGTLSLTAGKAN